LSAAVMVGFNRRFDPTFAEMRERVADGEIGHLEQLLITSRDPAPAPAAYIASSGGLFRDMTIHAFDMARFFLGEVVEVHARGAAPAYLSCFTRRYATAYRAELDHLVICVEQGLPPSPGFADGRAALVLADAATESMKTGRVVRVGS